MTKEEIIEKLKDDEHYYGEFGSNFLSNSNIKKLFEDPLSLKDPVEKTAPMVFGGYFHTIILEPDKVDRFKIIETSTRNTNKYKDLSGGEICLLQHEADKANLMKEKLMKNEICKGLIVGEHNKVNIEYEVPNIGEFFGNQWKCKADILNHDERLIIDIKTTGDIDKFRFSADRYNYDSQAYLYSRMFGYDFIFIVIDKNSHKFGIFECSDDFLYRGEQKLMKANEIYDLFYKTEGFRPEEYIETYTL